MGLLQKLQALGCQLKLVQMVPQTSTAPEKIETRSVTLQELTTELKTENVRILAESPVELTIQFEKIFETAGIVPSSIGWTIERFCNLLRTAPFSELAPKNLQRAVLETFASENVSAEDIIKDALAKDQALDAFEKFIDKKIKERSSARQMRLMEIEKQIGLLQQERDQLQRDNREEPLGMSQWQRRKQTYEKEIFETVDFLMNCNGQDSYKNGSKEGHPE
jgi:hypothetical protein